MLPDTDAVRLDAGLAETEDVAESIRVLDPDPLAVAELDPLGVSANVVVATARQIRLTSQRRRRDASTRGGRMFEPVARTGAQCACPSLFNEQRRRAAL